MRRLWRVWAVVALLLVLVVVLHLFPGFVHGTRDIHVMPVGKVDKGTLKTVENAAILTAGWIVKQGVTLPRDTPRIVRVYATRERLAQELVEMAYFEQAPDETINKRALAEAMKYLEDICGITFRDTSYIVADGTREELSICVAHELTHIFQNEKAGHRYIMEAHYWLVEGLADWVSYSAIGQIKRGTKAEFAQWLQQNEMARLSDITTKEQVHSGGSPSPGRSQVFENTAVFATDFLLEHSHRSLNTIFFYFSLFRQSPQARDENFSKAFGISHQNFEQEFEKWLDSFRK